MRHRIAGVLYHIDQGLLDLVPVRHDGQPLSGQLQAQLDVYADYLREHSPDILYDEIQRKGTHPGDLLSAA